MAYDKSGGLGHELVTLPNAPEQPAHVVSLTLPRAQLADRGDYGTDLMIAAQTSASYIGPPPQPVTICDVRLERSFTTPAPSGYGWLDLTVAGADGKPMPARIGLYDSTGRMPIPSNEAVEIKKFDDRTRTYLLRAQTVWPADNKQVFYVGGRYRTRLPAGSYRLVATRGIEYKFADEQLSVRAGETLSKTVTLLRWFDQPSAGWYSGDVHIHSPRRDATDERAMQLQAQAEDLHVANVLEMGNVTTTHFPQRGWGARDGRVIDTLHALVSGQEDPRTGHRGHTIHLDLTAPVRFPDQYLLFHKVFEAVAQQGGLSGYAHAQGDGLGTLPGLAIDGPFGLIDFVEIAQGGQVVTRNWFDLLNLGLRIAPAAGTDYPYLDHPGAVRNYVQVPGDYSVDGWFEGLGAGRTFVTTGPLLSFLLNGKSMGEEVRVAAGEPITIDARGLAESRLRWPRPRRDHRAGDGGGDAGWRSSGGGDPGRASRRGESQHLVRGESRGQEVGAAGRARRRQRADLRGRRRRPTNLEARRRATHRRSSGRLARPAREVDARVSARAGVVGGRPRLAEGVGATVRRAQGADRRGAVATRRVGDAGAREIADRAARRRLAARPKRCGQAPTLRHLLTRPSGTHSTT